MKRSDMKKIIRIRSRWTLGLVDYQLRNGNYLNNYLKLIVTDQLNLDRLGISKDGELYPLTNNMIYHGYEDYELTTEQEQRNRLTDLVEELMDEESEKNIDVI